MMETTVGALIRFVHEGLDYALYIGLFLLGYFGMDFVWRRIFGND